MSVAPATGQLVLDIFDGGRERMSPHPPEVLEQCSMNYWYPRLAGVPELARIIPPTFLLRITPDEARALYLALEGEGVGIKTLADRIWRLDESAALSAHGVTDWFLRTDQTSAKHQWRETCRVADKRQLRQHLARLVEFSACADLPIGGFALRQFIPLFAPLTLGNYGDMPLGREFRFFVRAGSVEHVQFYWPEDAVAQGAPVELPDGQWQAQLAAMAKLNNSERGYLTRRARLAGLALGGYWSVDFAQRADNGEWLLLDAAPGNVSFDTRQQAARPAAHGDAKYA